MDMFYKTKQKQRQSQIYYCLMALLTTLYFQLLADVYPFYKSERFIVLALDQTTAAINAHAFLIAYRLFMSI